MNWPFLLLILLSIARCAPAAEIDVTKLADAIYKAEGGEKAKKPFGILSVPCDGYEDCRRICENTIRNNLRRFANYGHKTHPDFLSFLASRYAPVSAHPLNKNWLKNVNYFLEKSK